MPTETTIQLRRGTTAQWTIANPVLALGEPGLETDTGREKRGDGVKAWTDLPYTGPIQIARVDYVGATDRTAEVQAAFDKARSLGDDVILPSGILTVQTDVLHIERSLTVRGAGGFGVSNIVGGGAVLDNGLIHAGTTLATSNLTGHLLTVNASTCAFHGVGFLNTALGGQGTTPTSGTGLLANKATKMRLDGCSFLGFYTNIHIVAGQSWNIHACDIDDPVRYGLWQQNTSAADVGDGSISDCTFSYYTRPNYNGEAAYYIQSGTGGKINTTKFNGGTGSFKRHIWVNISDGASTTDLQIGSTCSFENFTVAAIQLGAEGPNFNSAFGNVNINGPQISLGPKGIVVGQNIYGVSINNVEFQNLTSDSITLQGNAQSIDIGRNTHIGITGVPIVNNTLSGQSVTIASQSVHGIYAVYSGTNNATRADWDYGWNYSVSSGSSTTLAQITPAAYQGALIEIVAFGSVGVNTYSFRATRLVTYVGTTATMVTVGTDVGTNPAGLGVSLSFDTTSTPGTVLPKIALTGGGTANGQARIVVRGVLSQFRLGAF